MANQLRSNADVYGKSRKKGVEMRVIVLVAFVMLAACQGNLSLEPEDPCGNIAIHYVRLGDVLIPQYCTVFSQGSSVGYTYISGSTVGSITLPTGNVSLLLNSKDPAVWVVYTTKPVRIKDWLGQQHITSKQCLKLGPLPRFKEFALTVR
jgi:hypothetical protein